MTESSASPSRGPGPNDWGARTFETIADGQHYRLRLPPLGLTFDLARLRRPFGELTGDLTVRCEMAGARTVDGILTSGTLKVGSIEARQRMGAILATRAHAPDVDFVGLLDELSIRVDAAERQGAAPVNLASVPLGKPADDIFDVYGIRLARRHPNMLYGLGDSLKSFIVAVILGHLEHAGVRTLWIDWEMGAEDHAARLAQLYGARRPAIRHLRVERPLVYEIDRIRQIVHDENIGFAALDSVGFGCAGAPESAETALAFQQCVQRMKCGTLEVAHQAKGEHGDKTPFGSAFWFNSCRVVYHVKRAEGSGDDNVASVALYPTKSNLFRRGGPVGLDFAFSTDGVDVSACDVAEMGGDLAARLSVPQRLRALLKRGSMTKDALIAEFTDEKPDTIRRSIARAIGDGKLVEFPGPDGHAVVGLHMRAR